MRERPHVLLIMTDQHNWSCFGHRGLREVKTPHLDALAAGGTRFDECFCQHGTCVPSRTSYLTGQYAHAHGVFGNDQAGIPARLLSLPRYLQTFGYETAIIGKKHLPGWRTLGFQYERLCYHADAPLRNLHYYNYLKQHDLHALYDDLGDVRKFCFSDKPAVPVEHSLEAWTGREARTYLESRAGARPFFLMVSFERPHPPLTVPAGCPYAYRPEDITLPANDREVVPTSPFFFDRNVENLWCRSHHGEEVLRQALCNYYALISLIDHEVGQILGCLDQTGLRENTVVIFCADHGDYAGEYSRMAKGWMYDAIHRVPCIWNWPGRIAAGSVKTGLVETIDLFPTLCALLDIQTPRTVQGQDLSRLLESEADSQREAVFYEAIGVKTVRTKEYKLSYNCTGEKELGELFDLRQDPCEYENLFGEPGLAAIRERLLRQLLNWWIATQQPDNFLPGDEILPPTRWFRRF